MKDILITSSVLILALLVIRLVFKKVLSRRLQYALWGLVLVRLLVPINLPAVNFSVLTATRPAEQAVERQLHEQVFYFRPQGQVSAAELEQRNIDPENLPTLQSGGVFVETEGPGKPWDSFLVRDPETNTVTRYTDMKMGWTLLHEVSALVWKIGMVLVGAFFLLSNLWFWLRLRRCRTVWDAAPYGVSRTVYLVPEGVLPSPCLFLNAIYLTPAALRSEESLRHVLTHEETHARHLDPLWSFLRCVCLTVYWFNPLVWVAAACAKTDCELACDEAVLEKLGENERIPYGQTLLSLIPVKRTANPLLTATTMTAGKRQLKDRITRIAQNPRQLAVAVAAVAILALLISACTFAGGEPTPEPEPSPTPTPVESRDPNAPRSLTWEELRWFNEEFFNSTDESTYYYNIRNQFVNSSNLYDRPEDIDLFELFYCDGVELTEGEYRILGREEESCPWYKLTQSYMDEVLTRYTGLTLEQTNKVNLSFSYQEAIDAYIWGHGDTNYPGNIEFLYGTRKDSTVKLYHHGWGGGSNWFCTTLEEQPDGSYWFVSNRKSEKLAIPTPLPAWDPEATIPLSGLEPYVAPTVAVTAYPDHYSFNSETCYANWDIDGHHVMVYRADDGVVYAAYEENGVYYVFQSGLPENYNCVFFYNDLLGHRGFYLDYSGQYSEHSYGPIRDYYYFTGDGVLTLLARCRTSGGANAYQIDWDGDGTDELVAPRQLFFLRDGVIYEAQMDELLLNACPELSYWDYENWDKYNKSLYASGIIHLSEFDWRQWERYFYFDGENLLIYRDERAIIDHIVEGADVGVPAQVVAAVKECTEKIYKASKTPTVPEPEGEAYALGYPATWDDWRVVSFGGPYYYTFGDVTVEAWGFLPELHTTTPNEVTLAGGNYLTEDNWFPAFDSRNTVFFRKEADGTLTFLWDDCTEGDMNSLLSTAQVFQKLIKKLDIVEFSALPHQEYSFDLAGLPGDDIYQVLTDSLSGETLFDWEAGMVLSLQGTWGPSFATLQVRLELEDQSGSSYQVLTSGDASTMIAYHDARYRIKASTSPDELELGTLVLIVWNLPAIADK